MPQTAGKGLLKYLPSMKSLSAGLMVEAATLISSCPSLGVGMGWSSFRQGFDPQESMTMAFCVLACILEYLNIYIRNFQVFICFSQYLYQKFQICFAFNSRIGENPLFPFKPTRRQESLIFRICSSRIKKYRADKKNKKINFLHFPLIMDYNQKKQSIQQFRQKNPMPKTSEQSQQKQQEQQGQQQRPKRVRRTRKDCDQRSFICKICQKSYLSNAALYTHVKNKHDGDKEARERKEDRAQRTEKVEKGEKGQEKGQEKVSKTQKQPQLKQKQKEKEKQKQKQKERQKEKEKEKVEPKPKQKEQEQQPEPNPQSIQQSQPPEDRSQKQQKIQYTNTNNESLQNLRQFMKKYYPQRNKGCTIRLICQGLAPQILQYMQPILKQSIQLRIPEHSKTKQPICRIFGIFLLLMNLRVSSSCINFLIRFFYYLRNALAQQTKKPHYCQTQTPYSLPNYFNAIVLNQRIPAAGFDEDQLMYNPVIVCKVLGFFGDWLYGEGYTDYVLEPNYKEDV